MNRGWMRALCALCVLLLCAAGEGTGAEKPANPAFAYLDPERAYHLIDGFSSHLPVAVVGADGSLTFFMPGEAITRSKIDAEASAAVMTTTEWSEKNVRGRPNRDKKDYSLDISQQALPALTQALWDGTPVHDRWALLGNMYDKSLMRNYLALTLARELDDAVDLVRFCEVFEATPQGYSYQGVYTLTAPPVTEEYHMQRGDYWDEDSIALDTFATRQGILAEGLYVPALYALEDAPLAEMERVADATEASVFSGDYNAFSMFDRYLDLQKMYDHYILYELFGNEDMAHLPRYTYDPQKRLIGPLLLANFEFALDNDQTRPLELHRIGIEGLPYYSSLIKSINFVNGLSERYRALAQGMLGINALETRIDGVIDVLADARLRDWARWAAAYTGPNMYTLYPAEENPLGDALPPLERNTYDYDQEIIKLKFTLREHGQYIFAGIGGLYGQEKMTGNDAPYVRNSWLYIAFVLLIIASVRFVRRRMG